MDKFPYGDKKVRPSVLEKLLRRWQRSIRSAGDEFSFLDASTLWTQCTEHTPRRHDGDVELQFLVETQDLAQLLYREVCNVANFTYDVKCLHHISYAIMDLYRIFFVTPRRSSLLSSSVSVRSLLHHYGTFQSTSSHLGGIFFSFPCISSKTPILGIEPASFPMKRKE